MYKIIITILAVLILSATTIQAQAGEKKNDKDLTVKEEYATENLDAKTRLDTLAKPYNDVEISDGVSAGFISEREDTMIENKHRTPAKEKGREVGVGISLSF